MKSLTTITVLALALAASGPALAQLSTNTSAPIDITGDGLETGNNDCSWTWRGNVEALQDNARLRTDLLTGLQQRNAKSSAQTAAPGAQGGSCGDLIRLEAHGSVYYQTPQQKVHGDHAVYEAANETLTVTGNVVTVQGQNVLRGERLVVNTKTGQGQMETGVKGRNMPGRVRGVFYPNTKPETASAANGKPQTPAAPGKKPAPAAGGKPQPAPAGPSR
jgi:lipopolysaccharide export system protein LptA